MPSFLELIHILNKVHSYLYHVEAQVEHHLDVDSCEMELLQNIPLLLVSIIQIKFQSFNELIQLVTSYKKGNDL